MYIRMVVLLLQLYHVLTRFMIQMTQFEEKYCDMWHLYHFSLKCGKVTQKWSMEVLDRFYLGDGDNTSWGDWHFCKTFSGFTNCLIWLELKFCVICIISLIDVRIFFLNFYNIWTSYQQYWWLFIGTWTPKLEL